MVRTRNLKLIPPPEDAKSWEEMREESYDFWFLPEVVDALELKSEDDILWIDFPYVAVKED